MKQDKLIEAASFNPRSVENPNSWVGHLPFAAWIAKEVSPKIFVELGTHSGNSYFSVCQSVFESNLSTKCYAVDTWQGDMQAGFYADEIFQQVTIKNNDQYKHFSSLLRMTFDDALGYFPDHSIDLLHIDGLHTYEAVQHDFYSWLPKLAPGAVVMFHDTNVRECNFGVWKLWNELQESYPNNIEFIHSHGLGVLQLNDAPTDKILQWLQADPQKKKEIINFFESLGSRQLERFSFQDQIVQLQRVISEQHNRFVDQNTEASERNNQIVILNSIITDRDAQISTLNATVSGLKEELLKIYATKSWRYTEYLRKLKRIIQWFLHVINPVRLLNKISRILLSFILRDKNLIAEKKFHLSTYILPPNFDGATYLKLNPDLLAAGVNPKLHYLRHGNKENRLYFIPEITGEENFDAKLDTVLVVSHDASRTGAPVLALNIAEHLSRNYNVFSILLGEGELADLFAGQKKCYIQLNEIKNSTVGLSLIIHNLSKKFNFKFAICNSVESRFVLDALCINNVPMISLIHEFSSYIRFEDSFRRALFWSNQVIFSADIVRENVFSQYPDLADCQVHILPQGKCLHFKNNRNEYDIDRERVRIRHLMRPPNSSSDTFVVLGAGYVQMRKGVDLFIECAARVKSSLGEGKIRFVWIGNGYDPENDLHYSSYLKDQISRAGLQDCCIFINETFAIEAAYEEADLFLLSSRLDPLPNVAIEVMSYKVPVMCFEKTTGIANFLIENDLKEICVAQYIDTAEMGNKIISLINSPALYNSIATQCYEASIRAFDMVHYVSELERLALDAERQMKQEILDSQTILDSGLFQVDFYRLPQQIEQSIETHIRSYVRSWASGVGRRKPMPGFHPGIYIEQHGVSICGADPFADYIRAGCPQGEWNCLTISDQTVCNSQNLPSNKNVALHIHAYYPDLLPEIVDALSFNQIQPDLFVSVRDEASIESVKKILQDYRGQVVDVQVVPNRGRDIGPFLTQFGKRLLAQYEFIGHLHTKKSADIRDLEAVKMWREFLLLNLLGSKQAPMADKILTSLYSDANLGFVFPDDPNVIGWTKNFQAAFPLAEKMKIEKLPKEFLFPIGTMFWAKADALRGLIGLDLTWDDYPAEPLPYDSSVLHALERLFGFPYGNYKIGTTRVTGTTR